MKRTVSALVLVGALLLAMPAGAEVRVQALGLMPDAAVLRINGQQKFMRVGETGPYGVRLIRADSRSAEVEVEGSRVILQLSREVGSGYAPVARQRVQVSRDQQGHYATPGRINNQQVRFLIDTGASRVAISERLARQLGIRYRELGVPSVSVTAAGKVPSWFVDFASIRIGEIELKQVAGTVIAGDFPDIPLLGMSFLDRVRMSQNAGLLVLETR